MRNQFGETVNANADPALAPVSGSAATSLADAILDLEAMLEEAKWFARNKSWIVASVHISRAIDLLKAAQKIDEQHNDPSSPTTEKKP